MFKIAKNKAKHLCVAYRCTNSKNAKDRFCSKHRHRYVKENDPVAYSYHLLKVNAKRRGKGFNLGLEEFREFCKTHDYPTGKGVRKNRLSVDRIDVSKGYQIDNIQLISVSDNSKKWHEVDRGECPF